MRNIVEFTQFCKRNLIAWYLSKDIQIDDSAINVCWAGTSANGYICMLAAMVNDGIYAVYTYDWKDNIFHESIMSQEENHNIIIVR